MPQEEKELTAARQRRVNRLKRFILITLFTLIIIPIICCVVLFTMVQDLTRKLDALSEKVAVLEISDEVPGDYQEILPAEEVSDAKALSPEEDDRRKVYLTFDDGPGKKTGEILDILAQYDVKATFFVVDKEGEASEELLKRIVEEGHTLAMHSHSHKYSEIYASVENFQTDFETQRNYLEEVTGQKCMFYRFPGGSSNTVSRVSMQVLADYLDEQGVVFFDWNVASGDGERKLLSADQIVENCTKDLTEKKRAMILLHDSAEKPTTVEALPRIIETIQAMDNTVILPIVEETEPIQHIKREKKEGAE